MPSSRPPPLGSRSWTAPSSGFTLLELITVIALLGLALGELLPAGSHLLDRMAVLGAREAAVGLIHRARMEAVASGGARLEVESSPPAMKIVAGAPSQAIEAVAFDEGVILALSGDRKSAELTFDAMGVGRVASQTLRFSRGSAQAELVVSSFGRVTRR